MQRIEALESERDALRRELTEGERAPLDPNAQALLRDGEAYGLALGGNESHEALWATVFWTPTSRACYLVASGLPEDARYTLWAENRLGSAAPVGTGDARGGELSLFAELPFDPEAIRRVFLTPEGAPREPLLARAVLYARSSR